MWPSSSSIIKLLAIAFLVSLPPSVSSSPCRTVVIIYRTQLLQLLLLRTGAPIACLVSSTSYQETMDETLVDTSLPPFIATEDNGSIHGCTSSSKEYLRCTQRAYFTSLMQG
ncbi:hypothetical protein GOP47_0014671 [Adiantum capillus-veneris]|uniref:Secreted protein n=1 Tax=Adiantum capillus-veneris TaxID=13818 RepID=A0A9D4ZCD8_ADICA|nr:hypothetical protein GOP47_0014671 [Adiantum capillus-veneris]